LHRRSIQEEPLARLFVSQERIDRWSNEGKVAIDGDVMLLPALGRSFRLRPALYIARVVSDNADAHDLLGRVKSEEQLAALGAETYVNSVILGEVAYECEPGFLGEVVGGDNLGSDGMEQMS
jgi:hypothetical protein